MQWVGVRECWFSNGLWVAGGRDLGGFIQVGDGLGEETVSSFWFLIDLNLQLEGRVMNREDGTGCDGSSTIFLALCLDVALCPHRLLFKAYEITGCLHTRTMRSWLLLVWLFCQLWRRWGYFWWWPCKTGCKPSGKHSTYRGAWGRTFSGMLVWWCWMIVLCEQVT